MEQMYDIYIYRFDDPDSMIKVPGITNDDANKIADDWWARSDQNDCMLVLIGDDPFFDDRVNVIETDLDNLEEVLATW